jgi:23S rRNA (adenine2503-C2)-methyltransferase
MNVHPVARTPEQWSIVLAELAERPYRAQQIFRWIHARGVLDPAKMTDLAAKVRAKLASEDLASFAEVAHVHRAEDGTRKLVVRMADGAAVETVLIPVRDDDADADAAAADTDDAADAADADGAARSDGARAGTKAPKRAAARVTQCISTQVGCAMGCTFCASGVTGLVRNLGAHEIVAQVIFGRQHLEPGEELKNVVLMGMGEPLANYAETARALRLLTHPLGVNLSPRRITVSTVGLVPELARLGEDFKGQIGLAVSLHAADDETRGSLLPINRKYPVAAVIAALRAYPLPRRRRIFIEYTMIAGKNDSLADAKKLAKLLRPLPVKINLIPMNPIDASELTPPPMNHVHAFQQILIDAGYTCFVRKRRGDDVSAACGQLALRGAPAKFRRR